jgi:thiol-disulfide isomerase/thioredoxin
VHHTIPGSFRRRLADGERSSLPAQAPEYNRGVAALGPGAPFPRLTFREGNGDAAEIPSRETLYAVFKTTCPTCELTWPFLDRVRKAGDGGLQVVAVSQDDPVRTAEFGRRLATGLRTVYDPEPWPVSDSLEVTAVPTLFLVGGDGVLRDTIVGFDREKLQELADRASRLAGRPPAPVFGAGDREVPALRAG